MKGKSAYLGTVDNNAIPDVLPDHHVQHGKQLLPGDALIIIEVVHFEGNCTGNKKTADTPM